MSTQPKQRQRMFVLEVFIASDKDEDLVFEFVEATSHMSMRWTGPNYVISGILGLDGFDLGVILMRLGCRIIGQHMVYEETELKIEQRRASPADQYLRHAITQRRFGF